GIPGIYLDKDPTSPRRKSLYGHPGRYRKTEYGIEYRTPGNFWLASPKLVEVTHDLCDHAIRFIEDGEHMKYWEFDEHRLEEDDFWESDGIIANLHRCTCYDSEKLRGAIIGMDKMLGKQFMDLIHHYLPKSLQEKIASAVNDIEPDLYIE